ncbi:MAG TPA: hypothetical protein VD993_07180 [Chitinophagaceae bacterium]|nr:hypothetical protein [Chitinophagaceae bacterium]
MKRMFPVFLFCLSLFVFTVPVSAKPSGDPVPSAHVASPAEAKAIVQEILDIVGVNTSFEVRAAKIPNAAAAVAHGKKYILYNPSFMAALSKATGSNRWVPVAVLAHEIGHHLSGHTSTHTTSTPANELEADEFSGFVLRKMGADLEDAQLAIRTLSGKRASATHPARSDRMEAIAAGWTRADQQLAGTAQPRSGRITTPAITRKPVEAPKEVALDDQYIAYDVHFTADPDSRYYVTVRNNLIKVENNRLAILGKLHVTTSNDYPLVLKSGDMLMLVSKKGQILSPQGRELGQVSVHEK